VSRYQQKKINAPGKERLRQIYGVEDPTTPPDLSVLARRKYHEAIAKWQVKWLTLAQPIFGLLGLLIVLLPLFLERWRRVIESTPVVAHVFQDFSTFGVWTKALFPVLGPMVLLIGKGYQSGGWDSKKQRRVPFVNQVVNLELYPRTRREEISFYIYMFVSFFAPVAWFFVISLYASFIRIQQHH
jgi:hypothetical protein